MSLRKDVEREVKLREFYRSVEQLLTPEDKDYLFYALKEYNTYKSVAKLMLALNSCLDTPEKLDLLPYIRELLPRHDRKKFDSLAPYNRMAHAPKSTARGAPVLENSTPAAALTSNAVRTVTLQRPAGTSLGFSIRGGREHELGIYISHVDSLSLAEKSGLFPGDQILIVNGISFENITHNSAVLVLKSHDDLKISVKSIGRIPGKKISRNSFIWVDASGNPVEEAGSGVLSAQMEAESRAAGDRLLTSPDRRKVVLHADKKRSLGFSIRGGSEYSLGVYISVIDSGSPAEECGIQVGDQILDVNGHNFLNILHEEAVAIFRSYTTLIITIKSVGRLPMLPGERQREKETTRASYTSPTDNKTRSPKSPLSRVAKKHDEAKYHSDMAIHKQVDENAMQSRQVTVKKSRSFNHTTRPKSTHNYTDSRGYNLPAARPRANSTGSSTLPRMQKTNKPVGVSPLATSGVKATTLQTQHGPTKPREGHRHTRSKGEVTFNSLPRNRDSSMQGPLKAASPRSPVGTHTDGRKFFEYGMGTQMMMASTSSQAKQLLLDRARRLLSDSDMEALKDKLKMYERTRKIRDLISFLIRVLDTPEKIHLLQEVRSVLHPSDLMEFDELVSPHEVAALHERAVQDGPNEEVTNNYNMVLSSIQNGDGQRSLRRPSKEGKHEHKPPDLGAFGASAAQSVLYRAASIAPDLTGMQTKESFLAWQDEYDSDRWREDQAGFLHQTSSNAVILELPKNAPYIGLTIQGGVDTPTPGIIIREVREGGAAHNDGFLKPGFEIVEADGISLRGRTHDEAARILAGAFNSENPTLELIVVPN